MKIDQKVLRLQTGLTQIPQELSKVEQAIALRKTELAKSKEAVDSAEKKLRAAELSVREKEDLLRKAESKMMEVKTNEEYQAAVRENDAQKGEKGKLEEQAISLMSDVESQRQLYKLAETSFKDYEGSFAGDRKKLEEERSSLVRLLEEQLQKRTELAKGLEPKLASLYDRLSGRFKGDAIAVTHHETCSSCNMKIRPQLFNEVVSFRMIHQCPSCSKILVPQGLLTESEPSA